MSNLDHNSPTKQVVVPETTFLALSDRLRAEILHHVSKELAAWSYEDLYNYAYDRFVEELAAEARVPLYPTTHGVEL